jgi:excisionase family DNA binding protein
MREPWDIDLPAEENDTYLPADIDDADLPPDVEDADLPAEIYETPRRAKVHAKRQPATTRPKHIERREEAMPVTTELPQPAAPQLPQLATLVQVAQSLSVSPHTVRSWVRAGKLRSTNICRRLLFSPSEIERFLASSKS